MSEQSHSKGQKILIGVLIAIVAILALYGVQKSRNETSTATTAQVSNAAAKTYKFELAVDESAKKDALSEDKVNRERLRERFVGASAAAVDIATLDAAINAVLSQNTDIVFGVSIKDLGTGSAYSYGNTGAMTAASVTKVLTAVYYLKQVEAGNRSLNTVMSNGQTAQYNIEQMIVVSDNDAWHILNENLGYSNMQTYALSIGLASYDYTDNTISSADTALLLGDLYQRVLINESNTQLLLSYMERANYRDLIIPAVPAHDTTYHKAGEYAGSLNDAVIITNGTNTIVLSIYTKSTASYSKSRVAGLMQQITTPTLTAFSLN